MAAAAPTPGGCWVVAGQLPRQLLHTLSPPLDPPPSNPAAGPAPNRGRHPFTSVFSTRRPWRSSNARACSIRAAGPMGRGSDTGRS